MCKKYKIGYVQGTFDLFHVGHLNLLKKAKAECEHLIVGVVTDELNKQYKNVFPYISWEDRSQIVAAIKYVDQVIAVGCENENKIRLWEQYHYDCHFCGDDHNGWEDLIHELHKRGAEVKFFPYTQKISSSKIKEELKFQGKKELLQQTSLKKISGNIILYGAGVFGQKIYKIVQSRADLSISLWIDKNWGNLQSEGLAVSPIEELISAEYDKILIAVKNDILIKEIYETLLVQGIAKEDIYFISGL